MAGDNTSEGGTSVQGGLVSVSRDANLGKAGIGISLNGGGLQFTGTAFGTLTRDVLLGENGGTIDIADADHTLTVSSSLTGTGALYKRGAGTLSLTGTNAYAGTIIEAGRVNGSRASLGGNVALRGADTVLNLTDSGNVTYASVLSGTGQVMFEGDGTRLLTGNSAAFAGTISVNGGTLLVGNATGGLLGGSINVGNGATLGGSGRIGWGVGSRVTIASGAVLAPGNSIGTLSIAGDLVFENGARFEVEVDPLGVGADRVAVSGKAVLNGGTVAHIGATGN
ncbi:autotransporter-associated beta strand repeat-containing protein [Brevundimonas pishanensis]|uniref:autotransporter-associated beta strand repeat-containing protein n=1 Tax=Brevundimonas pishanensis TaxID=2896315 RepID=UPI003CFCDCC8